MPFPLPPSSSFISTAAAAVVIAVVVSFTVPSVSHFVVTSFPIIYENTVFLLKPPYLYLVVNCIIVSIVAASKLTHKLSSDFSDEAKPVPVSSDINTGYVNLVHGASDYNEFTIKNDVRDDDVQKLPGAIADGEGEDLPTDKPKPSSESPEPETEKLKPVEDILIPIPKHTRKPPRSIPQGGNKKTALGVTKPPKRQDTLETTWKKITEGRSTPLTKHLKKSDTWQERSPHVLQSSSDKNKKKMTKSENLNATVKETRLKREPSPGQEELNRRVEAFIKKFNEEMRLQRLESLAKYNEMVNGGTRL